MKDQNPEQRASEIRAALEQLNPEDVLGNIPALPKPKNLVRKSDVIDGEHHTWVEYVPACYDGSTAVPLLVGLHGGSSTGELFASTTMFTTIADQERFICLFPEATKQYEDEEGRHHIWNSYFFIEEGKTETGWLKQLIDRMLDQYNIDRSRIYLTGFSNGDAMALQLAVAYPTMFAAVAGLNGPTPPEMMKDAEGRQEVPEAVFPYMRWNGERDPLGDFFGLTRREINEQVTQFWIRHNRCSPVPEFRLDGKLNTAIYESECGAEYRFVEYKGGPHALNIEVAHVAWYEFFSRFARGADGSVIRLESVCDASADQGAVALAAGKGRALVRGKRVKVEQPMVEADGHLMIPVQMLSALFGAEVRLADDLSQASITYEHRTATILRDHPALIVDHQVFPFPVNPLVQDGTFFVCAETMVEKLLRLSHSSESGVLYISDRNTEISRTIAAKIDRILKETP